MQCPNLPDFAHAEFAHAEFAGSECGHRVREAGGKDFDLCKMGVYLGVYWNIAKIKRLINSELKFKFVFDPAPKFNKPEAQSVSGCFLLYFPHLFARAVCSTFLRLFYILKRLCAFSGLILQ